MSPLEYKFAKLWSSLDNGITLEAEYSIPGLKKKYSYDFAHPLSKTLIEIQGGIWIKGGHSTGSGITRDCQKSFQAIVAGFTLFHLTASMIDLPHLAAIADFILAQD